MHFYKKKYVGVATKMSATSTFWCWIRNFSWLFTYIMWSAVARCKPTGNCLFLSLSSISFWFVIVPPPVPHDFLAMTHPRSCQLWQLPALICQLVATHPFISTATEPQWHICSSVVFLVPQHFVFVTSSIVSHPGKTRVFIGFVYFTCTTKYLYSSFNERRVD